LRGESRNSATFFGSSPQLTFIKGVGDGAWYHPVAFGQVIAFRIRLGSIWGGADAPDGKQPPQQERLYAGGASSVRGFQQNELGSLLYVFDEPTVVQPNYIVSAAGDSSVYFTYDTTKARPRRQVPVGGNTLFVTNIDYRLPSPVLSQLLQFTLFADMGTVWNRQTHTQFGGFRPYWTPGVGVRVFSPLGPIQVNAGYNPYPPYIGQALYTPQPALAAIGYTGVYCAVPEGTAASEAPLAVRTIQNGKPVWNPNQNTPCPRTYHPPPPRRWINRLTFTFSIGSDF
jgi:outer membrane protein assembly factor BamA